MRARPSAKSALRRAAFGRTDRRAARVIALASPPPIGRPWQRDAIVLVALVLPWLWLVVLDRLLRRTR